MTDNGAGTSSPQLLNRIGKMLDEKRVNWATIGALAVAYHGVYRASLDADALISLKDVGMDLDQLGLYLSKAGLSVETRMGEEGDPLGFVVRITDDEKNQVDLIGGIRRLDKGFFSRVIHDEFDGLNLRIASPEDLIALKLFAGGPQDLADAKGVLEVQEGSIDKALLVSVCRSLGAKVEEESKKLLAG